MTSRMLWTLWALVPVVVVAWHFGPGQEAAAREVAARRLALAIEAEQSAIDAQASAYEAHLAAIAARLATFADPGPASDAALDRAVAAEATTYAAAAERWEQTAERYEAAIEAGGDLTPEESWTVRLARSRALVRSGDIWGGAAELRGLIDEVEAHRSSPAGRLVAGGRSAPSPTGEDVTLLRAAREELAAAHYFGARLLRLAGEPAEDWRAEAALARQQYRYLAETAAAAGQDAPAVRAFEDNVERVLDLEQQDRSELQATALPRESPRAARGSRPGTGDDAGRSRRPARGDQDARGASGVEAIGRGW